MTVAADQALAAMFEARRHRMRCAATVEDAQQAYAAAVTAFDEATYLATVAVPCPACLAEVDEQCRYPAPTSLHRYVTHGLRDEATGEWGPERAASAIAAGKRIAR